jgi:hypothetical protein
MLDPAANVIQKQAKVRANLPGVDADIARRCAKRSSPFLDPAEHAPVKLA